jgi:signal transduction histidine kinase
MKKPLVPSNEVERLKELENLKLLEDFKDEELDHITKLASNICGTKVSLVTLIDTKTQFFKSKYGTELEQTSRDVAFCAHAINTPEKMLIVNDATEDERFKENPLVTKDPKIAFYAGMPLSTKKGVALGTLCVIDSKPKVLMPSQIEALKSLAKVVERLFESRRSSLQLKKIEDQLQQQKNQTEEMAFAIAHDLKDPLDNIQGFLKLLKEEGKDNLSDIALQYITYASQSSEEMKSLIHEILNYTKLSVDVGKREWVDVEAIIKNIIELNLLVIKSEFIEIHYKELPHIKTSKPLLTIVMRNLIGNAIKYRSEDIPLVIKINIQDQKDTWVISVLDNGRGIHKENQEKIFKPFYKEADDDNLGAGMGLAICEKIVFNLGGKFSLDSELGKGSTFSFSLPK